MDKNLLRNLSHTLIRGARVKIGDSFADEKLRGVETTIRSKGLVTCNGRGRCAGDWCIGSAVFVVDPNVDQTSEDGKKAGWRHGAAKVCLTHLLTTEGERVLPPEATVVNLDPVEVEDSEPQPKTPAPTYITPEPLPGIVTWVALAEAHAKGDTNGLANMARALKAENENLVRRLVDAQDREIARLRESASQ